MNGTEKSSAEEPLPPFFDRCEAYRTLTPTLLLFLENRGLRHGEEFTRQKRWQRIFRF